MTVLSTIYLLNNVKMSHSFRIKLRPISLGLFLFCRVGFAGGYIGETAIFFETTAKVIMTAVYRTGTAFTGYEIMAVFGFDFVTADITANSVFDDQCESSFVKSSCIKCAP